MCMREDKKSTLGGHNWDEYRSMLAFAEFSGILENSHVIPGHVGILWCFIWLEDHLLFTDNSHCAPKENNVKEDCAVHPWNWYITVFFKEYLVYITGKHG